MTEQLYLKDAYLKECIAVITDAKMARKGQLIQFDRTCLQPNHRDGGDKGFVTTAEGEKFDVINVVSNPSFGSIEHTVRSRDALTVGQQVTCQVDWKTRSRLMRKHTANHLLYGCSKVISKRGYTALSKTTLGDTYTQWLEQASNFEERDIQEIFRLANELIKEGRQITIETLPRQEALDKCGHYHDAILPQSVSELRVVTIEGLDSDPCIGLHVINLQEIKEVCLVKVVRKDHDLMVFSDVIE